MATVDTIRVPFRRITAASDQTSVNTAVLGYGTTWATAGQNPANWPSGAVEVPLEANMAILNFAIADTDNDEGVCTIWGKPRGNGAPRILLVLNPIKAGTSVLETDPDTGVSLTNFRWADTITATPNNVGATVISNVGNDIAEVRFDLRYIDSLFSDWDMDLGSGTDGTDGIAYWTYI